MGSKKTEKYAAFFEYMGVPKAQSLTDVQLAKINEEGTNSWLLRTLRITTDRQRAEFERKNSDWWDGDRFVLHPDLYKTDIHFYLTRDLPELLATYIRGQFTGSTERITKQKIEKVVQLMLQENPNWWHAKNRKAVFLEKFKSVYPLCCDGPPKRAMPKVPSVQSSLKSKSQNQQSKKKGCGLSVLVVLAATLFLVVIWR
jgi:hypothetical protein